MQLAHAGWKASTSAPCLGGTAVSPEKGGWTPVGVGDKPFAAVDCGSVTPRDAETSRVEGTASAKGNDDPARSGPYRVLSGAIAGRIDYLFHRPMRKRVITTIMATCIDPCSATA